jgi:hypothetical protein
MKCLISTDKEYILVDFEDRQANGTTAPSSFPETMLSISKLLHNWSTKCNMTG